jgi:hypothetical protein
MHLLKISHKGPKAPSTNLLVNCALCLRAFVAEKLLSRIAEGEVLMNKLMLLSFW